MEIEQNLKLLSAPIHRSYMFFLFLRPNYKLITVFFFSLRRSINIEKEKISLALLF